MKTKKFISAIFIITVIFILGTMGSLQAYSNTNSKNLYLSYFRYVYENNEYVKKDGYAYNNGHPVFQIMSLENDKYTGTNYYCLNALAGYSWNDAVNAHVGKVVSYDTSYDLDSDLEVLKSDNQAIYSNIAKSQYIKQILWILDNMYISDNNASKEENLAQKQEVLAKAGLSFTVVDDTDLNGNSTNKYGYRYKKNNSSEMKVSVQALKGYFYYDEKGNYQYVDIADELVEVAQQAAIWYFTNYLDNNTKKSETFNVKNAINLVWSNGSELTNTTKWQSIENYKVNTDVENYQANVGLWQEEMAGILCRYLIDAANDYAKTEETVKTGSPLTMEKSVSNISSKMLNNSEYYVVGPIKINQQRDSVYSISNTIFINDKENKNAYISNSEGTKQESQSISNYIGKEFYITIPASEISGSKINIEFNGSYKTNKKILWTGLTDGNPEQPIVEVMPSSKPIELIVTGTLNKEFDLALRKSIIKITDANGAVKTVINENGNIATRNINYVAKDILSNSTATYNHRKDPVVVKNGDVVTYSITVYNEGDMDGYASEITDKLPQGLTINGNKEGTYKNGNVEYSYVYDEEANTITYTNKTKNVLKSYAKGETLSSETIEIDCKVTQEASSTTNIYLTNIAYISKEYNSETNQSVEKDRDSYPKKYPESKQNIKANKYDGYKGNTKNDSVYNDTNNAYYYKGEEDDDDFEIIVIKPVSFDLALQKYISSIYSNGVTKNGRKSPTINTEKLAKGTDTTATYIQDKTPIKVKHGDYVTYTFKVYNEGEKDGYVKAVTDNIPEGLEFVYIDPTATENNSIIAVSSKGTMESVKVDSEIYNMVVENNSYWSIDKINENTLKKDTYNGEETISITCDVDKYLDSKMPDGGNYAKTFKLLSAYTDDSAKNYDGSGLDSIYVTVILRVSAENGCGRIIRNEAAITAAEDTEGNQQDVTENGLKDRDSKVTEWKGKDGDKKYQDDEDFDNIILGKADIALTKFIVAVSEDIEINDGEYLTKDGKIGSKENPYTRATSVDTTKLRDDINCHDATYQMVKDPLMVPAKSYVLYDIRVYNEGETDLYAGEVTDYLPEYLDYVSSEFNDKFGWEIGKDGKTIKTSYLSYEKDSKNNLLKAFDKVNDDGKGSGLDYRDLQILCKVNDKAPTNTKLVNIAEITKYEDPEGDPIEKDVDSTPDNVDKENEDDDDYEVVYIRTFDLSLLKYVTTVYVTEDGKTTTTQTGNTGNDATDIIPKVEINRKKVKSTVVKFGYTIKITNEGDIEGYAKEITDYVPQGLKFYGEDNEGWVDEGNNVISTRLLENTLLKPGESAEVTVILRWINGSNNLGLKINTAEISEDYNEYNVPDRDSTPDNKEPGEDDIDDAAVLLAISTGLTDNIIEYITLGTIVLVVLGSGIVLIKKYIL